MSQGYAASVLFIGDSITADGVDGMIRFLGDAAVLQGARRVAVFGRKSSSAKDWLENRWHVQVAAEFRRPNVVVIALGTNVGERGEQDYAGAMYALAEGIQVVNAAEVFVVGPFAEDPGQKRNRALSAAFGGRNAINGYELAAGLPRAGEGNVHFTREGYKGLADQLCARIRPGIVRAQRPGRSIVAVGALLGWGATIGVARWWLPFLPP